MEIFQQIIFNLNKDEIRYYKLLNNTYQIDLKRLDEKLFDYTKKHITDYDDDKAFDFIYKGKNKNSFYRLKNRIISNISNSLLYQNIDKDSFLKTTKYLYLNKLFTKKNNYEVVKYYLKKAEKLALENEYFELLEIIYAEFLNLSLKDLNINPREIIEKRNKNSQKINELRKVDEVLAVVNYELKTTQNYSQKNIQLIEKIENLINSFNLDNNTKSSKRFNVKLYELISKKLLNDEDYNNLEKYLLKTYRYFKKENLFDESTHEIKLQILTYLGNSYFKNKKYKKSLETADILHKEMLQYNKLLYQQYYFFYINILVINYSVLNKDEAIQLLESLKNNSIFKKVGYYELFVYLNLSVLYFDIKDFKNSIKNISKIYLLSGYQSINNELKLKINVTELIIRYEINDFDYILSKIEQLKREFKSILNESENNHEKEFLALIKNLIKSQTNNKINTHISNNIKGISKIFKQNKGIINYYDWIVDKFVL
ncbi:MAG: hypothetical protein ACK4IK_06025 [Bacteroidia bacterium]